MNNNKWSKTLPVRGCNSCSNGKVVRPDYNEDITCPVCKGSGTIPISRWRSLDVITSQITKSKNNDS